MYLPKICRAWVALLALVSISVVSMMPRKQPLPFGQLLCDASGIGQIRWRMHQAPWLQARIDIAAIGAGGRTKLSTFPAYGQGLSLTKSSLSLDGSS